MRMIVRTSRWAIWARRLGVLAFLVAVAPIMPHRAGTITTGTFLSIEAGAFFLALSAIAFSIGAFIRLWHTGDRGWARGVAGLLLGTLCLSPAVYAAVQGASYPLVADVSTSIDDPPSLQATVQPLTRDPGTLGRIAEAFPDVTPRRYQLDAPSVFDLVDGIVAQRHWSIRVRRAPSGPRGEGWIDAIAMTLLGFRDEVAIRVRGDLDGSTVDMRSASLHADADLGKNGQRITAFLADLDSAVAQKLGIDQASADPGN
jgi:Protein of unknown function (DUF1499)